MRKISKAAFEAHDRRLGMRLLAAQHALRRLGVPVIVVVAGVEGAAKGALVNRLLDWLDARGVRVEAFWERPSAHELERPRLWRFWRVLPAAGEVGIYLGFWHSEPVIARAYRRISKSRFESELERIVRTEQMLADDGAVIVKIWNTLSQEEVEARLREAPRRRALSPRTEPFARRYRAFEAASARALAVTDRPGAPWHVLEAAHERTRDVEAGDIVLGALERAIAGHARAGACTRRSADLAQRLPSRRGERTPLADVEFRAIGQASYQRALRRKQGVLGRLAWEAWDRGIVTVGVFEGWDAAGKGGSIRRLAQALDARILRVMPIGAPSDAERRHHYLWRFWRHLPRAGHVHVFDRSWYGRVLVERVENLVDEAAWWRAYEEINEFESQLLEAGVVLLKFWLHISPQEQLRRFRERESKPWKQHKLTADDWRNRGQWPAYEAAVHDMVHFTSTERAPWTLVAAEDKRHARLVVLDTFIAALTAALRTR